MVWERLSKAEGGLMELVSLNIGNPTRINSRGKSVTTGIKKIPTLDPLFVSVDGIHGDSVLNTRHHGGPDQAVYAYRVEDYHWWSDELGREVGDATFGENLTLNGISSPGLSIGTQLVFDEVVLEVTAPRIPCQTLNAVMKEPGFAKRFAAAARSGFYFRVLKEGYLSAGEQFSITKEKESHVSTVDLFEANYRQLSQEELKTFLTAAIDVRTRRKFEKQLEKYR